MTIFYSEVEPHSKCSPVTLHLCPATRIINKNPDNYYGGADLGGRVQGVRTPPARDYLRFSNTTGILQIKKLCGLLVLK